MRQKIPQDVLGYQINCPDFCQCPICYGCRSYDPKYIKCLKCGRKRKNICDTSKHREDLLAKMITRTTINI